MADDPIVLAFFPGCAAQSNTFTPDESQPAQPQQPSGAQVSFCPVDRYSVADLAGIIHRQNPGYSVADISSRLRDKVNRRNDKLSPEHMAELIPQEVLNSREGWQKWKAIRRAKEATISAAEAYLFIRDLYTAGTLDDDTIDGAVARTMHDRFFSGLLFSGALPAPYVVHTSGYHDMDTPTIVIEQGPMCKTKASSVRLRLEMVDSPEVLGDDNYYDERFADFSRLDYIKTHPDKEYPYTRNPGDPEPINPKDRGKFLNGKLVDDVDKVHVELSMRKWDPKKRGWDPKKVGYWDRAYLNNIIAAIMDYTGTMVTVPMDDLEGWELDNAERGAVELYGTQICWKGSGSLCRKWQPYDPYMRMLGGLRDLHSGRLSRYLRTRLATVVAENEGRLLKQLEKRLSWARKNLKHMENQEMKRVAKWLIDGIPKPTEVFSQVMCAGIADAYDGFIKERGALAVDDVQVIQLIAGMAHPYLKYRSCRGTVTEAAGQVAIGGDFGLWRVETFRTLWNFYLRNPEKYHPGECSI